MRKSLKLWILANQNYREFWVTERKICIRILKKLGRNPRTFGLPNVRFIGEKSIELQIRNCDFGVAKDLTLIIVHINGKNWYACITPLSSKWKIFLMWRGGIMSKTHKKWGFQLAQIVENFVLAKINFLNPWDLKEESLEFI